MSDYVADLMAEVRAKNPGESEFHQAVQEVAESLVVVLEQRPEYRRAMILERIIEPERSIVSAKVLPLRTRSMISRFRLMSAEPTPLKLKTRLPRASESAEASTSALTLKPSVGILSMMSCLSEVERVAPV